MSLSNYFRERLRLMAPHESITLTRESLEWIMAQHDVPPLQPAERAERPMVARAGLTLWAVGDLAGEFRTAESSMRAHVAAGLFGDPGPLRSGADEGKRKSAFRVPAAAVEQVRQEVAAGRRLGSFCVVRVTTDAASPLPIVGAAEQVDCRIGWPPEAAPGPAAVVRTQAPLPAHRPEPKPDLSGWRRHSKQKAGA